MNAGLHRDPHGKPVSRSARQVFRLGPTRPRARGVGGEIRTERQFLEADELRALTRGEPNSRLERRNMLVRIGVPPLLERSDPKRRAARRTSTCR
jgi:hypothetical protein